MKKVLKVLKIIGIVIGVLAVAAGLLFGYLTIVEFRPEQEEQLSVSDGDLVPASGDGLTVMTYNIGYGAYDQDEDFFMDGGTSVRQKSADAIYDNLAGIASVINSVDPDICYLQEVDKDAHRSFGINEVEEMESAIGMPCVWACNFKVQFIPYPIPPIGRVTSGLAVYTDLKVNEAVRYALPCPFKWPVRIGNLKRCVLLERIPIEGSDKELVLMNFHLEAYDDGEGKAAQTKVLMELLEKEHEAGNYCIAGGDFNQSFEGIDQPEMNYPEDWMPGYLSEDILPDGYSFAVADNTATCRSLAREYIDSEQSQEYIIDGFIVSDNLTVEDVSVIDTDFLYSDHSPVVLKVKID